MITDQVWSPEEGRWTALKNSWAVGENKLRLIFLLIGSIPVWVYGERCYYESVIKYGTETFYAPHNLFRELFHFAGGALVVLCFSWNRELSIISSIGVFAGASLNEVFSDIPDTGLHIKNFVDVTFWTLGALTILLTRS
jgi:hypothetical protein